MKSMGVWVVGIGVVLMILFVPAAQSQTRPPEPVLKTALAMADESFRHRADPEEARRALREYGALARESGEKDVNVLWRVSMASYFVGLRLTRDPAEQEKIFAQGRDEGLRALAIKSDCTECQFWTAINMALYGNTVGVFKMLFSLAEIREHLRATLRLNPSYASGGAYRLLGLIEQKLPGILGGSNEKAREYFERAIAISPDEPLNYQFLAELEHDELNDPVAAVLTARKGLSIRQIAPDRPESLESQEELGRMLARWNPQDQGAKRR